MVTGSGNQSDNPAGPGLLLPNLIIAGVYKAGTTSLFSYLGQHPRICASLLKEIGYFDSVGGPGGRLPPLKDYAAHFVHCEESLYRLEASPSYWPGGKPLIAAMRELLPRPRVIVSLRDPVERLWSAYTYSRSRGQLDDSRALDDYVDEWRRVRALEMQSAVSAGRKKTHLALGFYADQLPYWMSALGDDLRIVFSEQLASDAPGVVGEIFDWLGLERPPSGVIDYRAQNITMDPRSRTLASLAYRTRRTTNTAFRRLPGLRAALRSAYHAVNTTEFSNGLSPSVRTMLNEVYAESNAIVAQLLRDAGHDRLPAWLGEHA